MCGNDRMLWKAGYAFLLIIGGLPGNLASKQFSCNSHHPLYKSLFYTFPDDCFPVHSRVVWLQIELERVSLLSSRYAYLFDVKILNCSSKPILMVAVVYVMVYVQRWLVFLCSLLLCEALCVFCKKSTLQICADGYYYLRKMAPGSKPVVVSCDLCLFVC